MTLGIVAFGVEIDRAAIEMGVGFEYGQGFVELLQHEWPGADGADAEAVAVVFDRLARDDGRKRRGQRVRELGIGLAQLDSQRGLVDRLQPGYRLVGACYISAFFQSHDAVAP